MLVSTRLATRVEILSFPVALRRRLLGKNHILLALALSRRGLVEQPQSFFEAQHRLRTPAWEDHADAVAGRQELDVVARLDAVLVRNVLRDRDLELAGDFGHVLTLARAESLLHRLAKHDDISDAMSRRYS